MTFVYVHCLFYPWCLVDHDLSRLMSFNTAGTDTLKALNLMFKTKLDNPTIHHCNRCRDSTKIKDRTRYLHRYIQAAETVQELEEMLIRHQEDECGY